MTDLSRISDRELWELTDIEAVSLRDQVNAYRRDVSAAVARHYTTMIDTGMDAKHAVKLTRDYQADLMATEAEVNVFVGGDE
jgi:hypothetical protein